VTSYSRELEEEEVAVLSRLISKATLNAISGIAEMIGRDIAVRAVNLREIPLEELGVFLKNPESKLVGIDLQISGDAEGNMLLIYTPQVALGLVDLLTGNPLGETETLEEMGESALGEMGNVAGGFFLNSLADDTGMRLLPSPPRVSTAKVGDMLEEAIKPLVQEEGAQAFVLQTVFRTEDRQISGNFLVVPNPELLAKLIERAASSGNLVHPEMVQYQR
jgi:chemotaxis protein CheC